MDEAADKPTRKRPLHDLDAIREARRRANSISVPESNKALEGLGAFEAGDDVAEIPLIDISGDIDIEGRLVMYPVDRARGVTDEIKTVVVAFSLARFRKTITSSRADECLREYRRLLKRLNAD